MGQNRTGIDSGIDEVDGAACFGDGGFEGLFPGFPARERREQGRVDIDNPPGEIGKNGVLEAAHEAGADNQVAAGGTELVADGLLGEGAEAIGVVARINPLGRNAPCPCPLENFGMRIIGEDEGDFGREDSGINGIQKHAEIGSFPGAEDAEAGKR